MRFSLLTLIGACLIASMFLCLGFTIYQMSSAFNKLANDPNASPDKLADSVARTGRYAAFGAINGIVGVALIIIRIFQRRRQSRQDAAGP